MARTRKCIMCKIVKSSEENYDRSPSDGRRMSRCKDCQDKIKEKAKYKKCSSCQKTKLKTEYSNYSNGKIKRRCISCEQENKLQKQKNKKKTRKIPIRETIYERKRKEKATAEQVLEIAKLQEKQKLKEGSRFVRAGIRAYVLRK